MFKRGRTMIAIPPGATIRELIEDRGMTQKALAARMELSEKHISELVNGHVQLTPDVAGRLEMVLGLSARFWLDLEAIYRAKLRAIEAEEVETAEIELAKQYPYAAMAKHGWVPQARKAEERVIHLRRFFEVVDIRLLSKESVLPGIACRRSAMTEKGDRALVALAQRARIVARDIDTGAIDLKGLRGALDEIRGMTDMDAPSFCPALIALLSRYGVALVLIPHIGRSFLNGATFLEGKKIVMGLTDRGAYADIFWFSLFHEIAHILEKHIYRRDGTSDEDEARADAFARDALIAPSDFDRLMSRTERSFSENALRGLAERIGVGVGVLVGRLQNDGKIPRDRFNALRQRLSFAEGAVLPRA